MKQALLIILGFLALSIGAIGILLPILPTTPFVIAAALFFSSSSPKLYKWLLEAKYFGDFIDNYKNKTGVKKAVKVKALLFLWGVLIPSAYFSNRLSVSIILAIVGICITLHIVTIKSKIQILPQSTVA